MKAVVYDDGSVSLQPDDAVTDLLRTRGYVEDPQPAIASSEVAESYLDTSGDPVVRRWTVRNKTDAEAQQVIQSPQFLWIALTNAERRSLWLAAVLPDEAGDDARLVLGAFLSATEIQTRNFLTKGLVAICVQRGWLTGERAQEVFGDPGIV